MIAAGDSLTPDVGAPFSTYDVDNYHGGSGCSLPFLGAWWYQDCSTITSGSCSATLTFTGCVYANINGPYNGTYGTGVIWKEWSGYSLVYAQMMLRSTVC